MDRLGGRLRLRLRQVRRPHGPDAGSGAADSATVKLRGPDHVPGRSMLVDWTKQFPGCEPIAHQPRVRFPSRWVRFHSLPESKRYPDCEGEYETVLNRFNRVLGELSQTDQTINLLTTGTSFSADPGRSSDVTTLDPDAKLWRTVSMHDADEGFLDPVYWHVFVSTWPQGTGRFDQIIRLVADWKTVNVMVVPPDCRWLLHPYDGGMDVIAESTAARDRLRSLHTGWLSSEPSGL